MNNFDRNTRTLIVSFLIAIFALIPLRFIEVGEQQYSFGNSQVLGESVDVSRTDINEVKYEVGLEAPYDKLESCVSSDEIKAMKDQAKALAEEIKLLESKICQ